MANKYNWLLHSRVEKQFIIKVTITVVINRNKNNFNSHGINTITTKLNIYYVFKIVIISLKVLNKLKWI